MSANEQPTKWPRTNRLAAALEWQQGRARLLPLHWIREDGRCSCGKGDCGSPGKHPIASAAPHGVNDAVSDREEIEAWWTRYPEANIGVAVGDLFVVLDVDDRAGGDEELSRLEALHGALPDTPEAQTGGGGRHVFFAPDERFRNSGSVIAPGIDTKGQGGYIVGAGSNHATGGTYEHDAALRWGEMPLAPVPGWILEALTGPRAARPRLPEVIRKSQRNPHLWREACNLVRRGWQADEIVTALLALNERCDPPGERAYVEALARRARATYAPAGAMALTAADAAQGACVLAPRPVKAVYPLTDVGNRDRLVDRHGHRLRYCAPLGHYLVWDGVVWRHAVAGEVVELAIETIDALPDTERGMHMVPGRKEGDEEDALPRWVKASQAAARIDAMVRLAQSHPDLQVGVDDLDQFPWLLTVENGTVDLLTGRLLPSDPAHLITLQAPVRFDPQAKAPRFCQFIHEVFGGREPLVRFAQEFIGYCLTGATSEAVMLILHGQGSNGKSILLEVLAHVLGPYAREAAPTAFVAARNVDGAERSGGPARCPFRQRRRDVGQLPPGHVGDQTRHRRRRDHGPFPAPGVLQLPAAVQAADGHQPRTRGDQRRPRHLEAPAQAPVPGPVRPTGLPAGGEQGPPHHGPQGGGAGYPELGAGGVPPLDGAGAEPADRRGGGDRGLRGGAGRPR